MIIDAHVHIMPQRRLDGLSIWLGRVFPNHPLAGKHFTEDVVVSELSQNRVGYIFNYVFPMKESETEGLNLFNYNLGKKFKAIIDFKSQPFHDLFCSIISAIPSGFSTGVQVPSKQTYATGVLVAGYFMFVNLSVSSAGSKTFIAFNGL